MAVKSDIEIAQAATLKPISEIASKLGIPEDALIPFGHDMTTEYFENSWRVCCFGGFVFGREAVKTMKANGGGSLLYTGASASLRGKAGFGAFNSSKAALRTLAQAFAKESCQLRTVAQLQVLRRCKQLLERLLCKIVP